MLALLAATLCIPCFQDPAPSAPAAAADTSRAEFAAALEVVHAKLRKREWKAADAELASLLARCEQNDVARGKLLEIEEIACLSAFWSKHPAPQAKTLLYGDLTLFDRTLDTVKLNYAPGRLAVRQKAPSKRKPIAVPAFDTGEKPPFPPPFPDFEQVGQLTLHPLQFNGPYTVEVKGKLAARPVWVPTFVFLLDQDEFIVARFDAEVELVHMTNGGRDKKTLESAIALNLEPGAAFNLQASVSDTTITLRNKGRILVSAPKPKGRFGWFGFLSFDKIDSIEMAGKSYGQWLDSLVDSAVESDRLAFEAQFDARKVLPAWLYDVPDKAERDARAEDEAIALVQKGFAAPMVKRIEELTKGGKWAELLSLVDAADEKTVLPLPRAWTRAQALYQLEKLSEARDAARTVVAAAPKHKDMRFLEAALTSRLDDPEQAIATARALVRDFSYAPEARELLVTALIRADRLEEAQHEAESGFAAGVERKEMAKLVAMTRRALTGPTWRTSSRFESKHYVVASDMDRDTCVQLSKVLEEAYAFLEKAIGPVPAGKPRMRVYVFSGKQAYTDYCEDLVGESMNRTLGMFTPALAQLLFWNAHDREQFLETARHEAFHQFLDEFVSDPPLWLNEGLAQYFQTLRKEKGKMVPGEVRTEVVPILQMLEKAEAWPKMARLFEAPREIFYGEHAEAWYAVSWCVVHALANGAPQDRPLFDALIARLARGVDGAQAVRETFEGVDLDKLLERVRAHAKSL